MEKTGLAGSQCEVVEGDVLPAGGAAADKVDFWLVRVVHELCQPLTALECLLYVNQEPVAEEPVEAALLRSVLEEALVECRRMQVIVKEMQERLSRRKEVLNGSEQATVANRLDKLTDETQYKRGDVRRYGRTTGCADG